MLHHDAEDAPPVSWAMHEDLLRVGDKTFAPAGASMFVRYDVFSLLAPVVPAGQQALNAVWYDFIKGWALAYPEIGMLNRGNEGHDFNKLRGLIMARACGFNIPETIVTNDYAQFKNPADYIAKPVNGGAPTCGLEDLDNKAAPYFVQEKLDYPELRIFRAGKHYFGFGIGSKTLDSRNDEGMVLTEETPPPHLVEALRRLTDRLNLEYAAADFKTCPRGRGFLFLEVNTMPVLTGYDNAVSGRLSDAILLTLLELTGKPVRARPPGWISRAASRLRSVDGAKG